VNAAYVAMAAALGTPTAMLLIYLFSRRSTLRSVDATTDSAHVTTAAAIVESLQDQVRLLMERLAASDAAQLAERTNTLAERASFTDQLTRAHEENLRISGMVARIQVDLDIANRRIEALRVHLPSDLPDNTQMLFKQENNADRW
jgi:hypothetical protein